MKLSLFVTALYFVACAIHEAGHVAPAIWYGLPWRIGFGWFGPYARVQGRYVARENCAVALGGPVASILAGLAVWRAGFPACAIIVGCIGFANVLDFWHAVKALQLPYRKEDNNNEATSSVSQ